MSKYYPSKVKTRTLISREKWFFMLKIRIFNQSESACYRIWPSLCQNYSFSMSGIKTSLFASAGVRILTAGPTMSRFKETCQFNLNSPFLCSKFGNFENFWNLDVHGNSLALNHFRTSSLIAADNLSFSDSNFRWVLRREKRKFRIRKFRKFRCSWKFFESVSYIQE